MTPRKRRIAPGFGLLLLVAVSSAGALVIGEFALRALGPRETQYFVWPPYTRRQFVADPAIINGVSTRSNFTTNSFGLRGDELLEDSSVFRVLVVGGSTTENLYLDDSETWTYLLQQELDPLPNGRRVWVGSAGRSGMSARDHAVQVERLLDQLPRIDLLLVLVGINDETIALAQGDTFHAQPGIDEPGVRARREARAFSIIPGSLNSAITYSRDAEWWRRTALWQLLARVRHERQKGRNQMVLAQDKRGQLLPGGGVSGSMPRTGAIRFPRLVRHSRSTGRTLIPLLSRRPATTFPWCFSPSRQSSARTSTAPLKPSSGSGASETSSARR